MNTKRPTKIIVLKFPLSWKPKTYLYSSYFDSLESVCNVVFKVCFGAFIKITTLKYVIRIKRAQIFYSSFCCEFNCK